MTTIAFCGRYLAADTTGIRSGNRSEYVGRKIEAREGYAFATGGYWGHYREQLIAWAIWPFKDGNVPDARSCPGAGVEGAMLMISPQRELFVFTHEAPFPDPEAAPFALGTGGDIALGAMGAGKTAMEAVQIAARWDIKTGGPIDFIDLEWPEKGVQRWDGAFPVPVQTMIVDDPSDNSPVEAAKIIEWYTKDMGRKNKMEPRPSRGLAGLVEDADEEGNPRVSLAHELVHTQHAGGVIGRSDICEHGYVRSTCSRCVAKAVAEVRDAQANGHA